jgi:hypothetical protein
MDSSGRILVFRSRIARTVAATALTITGVTIGGAAPAFAAYPTNTFSVSYGQTNAHGTLTWYNRSIGVSGSIKTTDGNCRQVVVTGVVVKAGVDVPIDWVIGGACSYSGEGSRTETFSGTINTDTPGAASYVETCFYGAPLDAPSTDYPQLGDCVRARHP